MFRLGKNLKRILLKFINKYSLIYAPVVWLIAVAIVSILIKPFFVLNVLTILALIFSFILYLYTSNRGLVIDGHNFSNFKYTIIEYYSDYWLGCTASKFIVDEFKKNNPNIPIVTVNASKKGYEAIREKYRLKFTPTYVLVDSNGEKIHKRVGSFSINKFNSLIS